MKRRWWLLAALVALDQLSKSVSLALGLPHHPGSLFHLGASLGVAAVALFAAYRHPSLGLILIAGGGVSNLIDAIIKKEVQDIFLVKSFAFNLADIFITAGFTLIFITYLRSRYREI